jgi:hypothetical protein
MMIIYIHDDIKSYMPIIFLKKHFFINMNKSNVILFFFFLLFLKVYRVTDTTEFIAIVNNLTAILGQYTEVKLIVIDSIGTIYIFIFIYIYYIYIYMYILIIT